MIEEMDPNRLREVEIRRLAQAADEAFRKAMDPELAMRMRGEWHTRYTNTVLALNQLLKDAQYKEYERRIRAIEEFEKEQR